jgi:hypothetical protein
MERYASGIRCGRKVGSTSLLLASLLVLGTTTGFAISPGSESIQATYTRSGNAMGVTLVIYGYTTPSEMQILSQAFEEGQDQGLVTALSKTRTAGLCSLTGELSFDVAFIQMVETSTGRQITFVTNRPLQSDEVSPGSQSQSFDLMVGQFDLNDSDNSKSTGFLYPASRLAADEQGRPHYDLAGNPWSLVNVFDSNQAPAFVERQAPNTIGSPPVVDLTP